jgi:hypothetical protein
MRWLARHQPLRRRISAHTPSRPSPSPSPPAPVGDWLVVDTQNVALDCGGNQQATITLTNNGTNSVGWTDQIQSGVPFSTGISVQPRRGNLDPGDSVHVTIKDTATLIDHSGIIYFVPNDPNAGQPAQVAYQAPACGNG